MASREIMAKSNDTQCLGFGKKDIRRCRLERRPGGRTCQIHRNYYNNWLEKHPMFDCTNTVHGPTERQLEEYRFQVKGGHVPISEQYLATIPPRFCTYYVFLLLNTSLSPSLNPKAMSKYIDDLLSPVFTNTNIYFNKESFKQSIVPAMDILLQDLPSCILVFESVLSFIFRYVIMSIILETEVRPIEWILEVLLLENNGWKQLLYCTQPLKLYMEKRKIFLSMNSTVQQMQHAIHMFLDPVVIPILQLFHVVHASRIAASLQPHKEEIIASACHPRRMVRLLDMGYTLEEILEQMD
jgi:hypothetical protein